MMVVDQLPKMLIGFIVASMVGLQVTEIANAAHGIATRFGVLPKRWENEPYPNQRVFPKFMEIIIEQGSLDTQTNSVLGYYIGLGVLVTCLAVVFETSLIALSTGGAILAYQTLGIAPDLVSIYQQIVILTVLPTIAAMTYGTEKVQQDPVR